MKRLALTAAALASLVALDAGFTRSPLAWTHRVDDTCSVTPKPWMRYAEPVRLVADLTARVLHVPATKRPAEAFEALTASCAARRGWFRWEPDTIVIGKTFPGTSHDHHRHHRRP